MMSGPLHDRRGRESTDAREVSVLNTDFVNSDEKSVLSDKQSHEHDSDDFAAMPR